MFNNNERIGVGIVTLKINKDLNWIFREQPIQDFGIDAHIEIHSGKEATGKLIALQIKSGPSYFQESDKENVVFRGKKKHLDYWLKHSLPVLVVLCDINNNSCIWEQVTSDKVEIISDDTWKMLIPKHKILGDCSRMDLVKVADNLTEYERRLNSLILAKPWMLEIEKGNIVILESDEWINKSSGRGSILLKVIDSYSMEEKIAIDWPIVLFPGQNYEDVFYKLFPWANIDIDEDFYEEFEIEQFKLEECPYDNEIGEYIFFGEFYQEWKSSQPRIRPYQNSAGEVDSYRLLLSINDIGLSFLSLDNYLERKYIYNINERDLTK